jgi:DNA repair protein RecN (Recombination protein N)
MLIELRIENFAIIDQLELEPGPGLVIFTGETGAGKSIILDAIEALMGGRADLTMIRSGSDRASIEGVFRVPDDARKQVVDILEREDVLDEIQSELVLSRELRSSGRTVARVNGRSVNVSLLRELGAFLIDIHGQSEHLSLLNVRQHLGLLDRFADADEVLVNYQMAYSQLTKVRRDLNTLRKKQADALHRTDLLTFQVQEIDAAHLVPGEEEELKIERDRLANAETLSGLAQRALTLLDESDMESPSIVDLLGEAVESLYSLSRIDASQSELSDRLGGFLEELTDVSLELRDYAEQIEFDPKRLNQIEERLDLIRNLNKKYGGSIEAVLAYAVEANDELELITTASDRMDALQVEEGQLLARLAELGLQLSARRKAAAEKLGSAINDELGDLKMPGARFSVDFRFKEADNGVEVEAGRRVAFDETGMDQVEFLIAPNLGEGFKPLVKVASGGETSRLMLALKNVLARADRVPTLIFDEIDQGIGGRIGIIVGEKLWQLGRSHQVLCVTHLPQMAAFGDRHFKVRKALTDGRTLTQVTQLEKEARVDELALMMGAVSKVNQNAAIEILKEAFQRRSRVTERISA